MSENIQENNISAEQKLADTISKSMKSSLQEVSKGFNDSIGTFKDEVKENINSIKEEINTIKEKQDSSEKIMSKGFKSQYDNVKTLEGEKNIAKSYVEESKAALLESLNRNKQVAIKSLGSFKPQESSISAITNKSYNTYQDINGGYSVNYPDYMGLYNANRLAYAPVVSLSRQVQSTINGTEWVGLDESKLTYNHSPEMTKTKSSKDIELSRVKVNLHQLSAFAEISTQYIDARNEDDSLKFDIVGEYERSLSRILLKKQNDETMAYLKDEMAGITDNNKKIITSTTDSLLLDDIINMSYGLKDEYLNNAVFLTRKSTLAALAKEKATSGDNQYIWRGLIEPQGMNMMRVSTPVGSILLMGISDQAENTFDTPGAGNLIGIFANFNEYLVTVFKDNFRMMQLLQHTMVDGYHLLYERTYFGKGLLNREAGKPVYCKSN